MRNDHPDRNNDIRRDQGRDPRHDPRDAAIDDELKQALRAEDPGAAFTQRVLARAREERAAQQSGRPLHSAAIGRIAAKSADSDADASLRHSAEASEASEGSEVSDRRSEVSTRQAQEVFETTSEVSTRPSRVRTQRLAATRKLIAALAASLTLAAAGAQWMQHRRYVAEGERARAQVLAALRLTNEKLDIVHDQITERGHAR